MGKVIVPRSLLTFSLLISGSVASLFAQVSVHVRPADLHGSRTLPSETADAAVRDYLLAFHSMSDALQQNRPELLNPSFLGDAKQKLAEVVAQQSALHITTRYTDTNHDIQIILYSPEGLSIQMIDTLSYDLELLDHAQVKTRQHVICHYVIVLTPAETRWKVRVFQADSN